MVFFPLLVPYTPSIRSSLENMSTVSLCLSGTVQDVCSIVQVVYAPTCVLKLKREPSTHGTTSFHFAFCAMYLIPHYAEDSHCMPDHQAA